jgi:hypothetical protein
MARLLPPHGLAELRPYVSYSEIITLEMARPERALLERNERSRRNWLVCCNTAQKQPYFEPPKRLLKEEKS